MDYILSTTFSHIANLIVNYWNYSFVFVTCLYGDNSPLVGFDELRIRTMKLSNDNLLKLIPSMTMYTLQLAVMHIK